MSISVKNSGGDWIQCAGQGRAEYGASTYRSGTINGNTETIAANAYKQVRVTFSEPMPDTNYELILGVTSTFLTVQCVNKQTGYFDVEITNGSADERTFYSLNYTAFKLYTDTEYNQVLDSVPELVEITSLSDVRALSGGKVYDLWVKSPITISGVTIPKFAECVYFKPVLNRDQTLSFHNVYTGEGGLACITDVFFNTDGTYAVKQYT